MSSGGRGFCREEQKRDWKIACENTRRLLASLDMDLWTMRTSFHRLDQINYESHGAMVIACLPRRRAGTSRLPVG